MKSLINKLLFTIPVVTVMFKTLDVSWTYYLLLFSIVWITARINLKLEDNKSFYISFVGINIITFSTYCIVKYQKNNTLLESNLERSIFLIIFCVLIVTFYILLTHKEKSEDGLNQPIIMPKREKDLEILMKYIENFRIVGLNGRWGTGKTFLINEFIKKAEDKYEIIVIDLMTSNLAEVQSILIKEFEELMLKYRILPKNSAQIYKKINSSSLLNKLSDLTSILFAESKLKSEIFSGIKDDLRKINKDIIVIYEDLDRITDIEVIKNIFSISEKLSNNQIRIIYQFDENKLKELGLTHDYLEKYIPYKINLSELSFWEVLKFELKELNTPLLEIIDFDYLKEQRHHGVLYNLFKYEQEPIISVSFIPIRQIKQLLSEILFTLDNAEEQLIEQKQTIISYFILKHLYNEGYEKINIQQNLLDSLKIKINNKNLTIYEFNNFFKENKITQDDLEEILEEDNNKNNIALINLFNFEFKQDIVNSETSHNDRHTNEKINRIIWYLHYKGKSSFTDNEFAIKMFKNLVLDKPKENQKENFKKFWNLLFYKDILVSDNNTIFKIGKSNMLSIFESFKLANTETDYQLKLIDYYFSKRESVFDLEVVQCMNCCPLNSREEYITIVKNINMLEIQGNLNDSRDFIVFLQLFIDALSKFGYINTYDYLYGDEIKLDIELSKIVINAFEKINAEIKRINKLFQEVGFESTQEDLENISTFIEKLLEIIKTNEKLSKENNSFISEFKSTMPNESEFLRLSDLLERKDCNTIEQINSSYTNNKISVYELEQLYKKHSDWLRIKS